MKEISRLKEMSIGLQKGSAAAIHVAEGLKMIVLNLKIQTAYIENIEQKNSTSFTIEKLTTEIAQLKTDIAKIGFIGIRIGELDLNIEQKDGLINLINELEEIAIVLHQESKNTFSFLEKLRYICLNLEIQATHMKNSLEAKAISVIVKALVNEISTLQKSAKMVQGSSEVVSTIVNVLKEQTEEKQKVKTK